MTMPPSRFKTLARAAIVALALGSGMLAVIPAQAQQAPAFTFNLDVPGGQGTMSFGGGNAFGGQDSAPMPRHQTDGANSGTRCLTNREIRRGVEAYGYDRVEVSRDLEGDHVEVAGQYGNWLYSMRVDKCTGAVDRVERVRRLQGGGFGLQFSLGN